MASGGDMEEGASAISKAPVEVLEEAGKKKKIDRHCAFCLTLIPGDKVKVCSKCKRRAYCSKECQKADWKATPVRPASNGKIYGYGQGHKNWCGLGYGEEDLDWKVVPIEGKGLGIVALRDLPYLYRILVEGMQHPPGGFRYCYCCPPPHEVIGVSGAGPQSSASHPAMNDLHPANSDITTKFFQNHVFTEVRGRRLGLRLSRINHSCRPNASVDVDHPIQNLAVFVVFSEREIKAGEEICRSYMQGRNFPFKFASQIEEVVLSYKTPEECREEYSRIWGFVCPPSCPCRDENNEKLLEELQELGEYCKNNPLEEPALQKFERIIENAKEFGIGTENTSNMHMLAMELAVTRRQTLDEARKHLQTMKDMFAAIIHPSISDVRRLSALMDVSNHPKYLAAER